MAGAARGRASEDQLTLCDLTGLGAQDIAAAIVVLENAEVRRLGERVSL